jgi:hypothetical protein
MTIPILDRPQAKARRSLTLDAEVAAYLDASGNASGTANELLHDGIARRERRAALAVLVADLEAENGPPDPARVAAAREHLLS